MIEALKQKLGDEVEKLQHELNDYAYSRARTLAFTPELSPGCDGCGFVFPDDPDLVLSPDNAPYLASKIGDDIVTWPSSNSSASPNTR